MADLEDALKKLDRLTQEEARMANAEVLRITNSIRDGVKSVDGKVEEVGDRVQVVINGARCHSQLSYPSNVNTFRQQASESSGTGNEPSHSASR